jgi:hypothetical protein
MSEPFSELRERLLEAGVAPRHVRRYLRELGDHFADLAAEEVRAGCKRADAKSAALRRLGSIDELASAMIERREFQSLSVRAPWAMFGLAPIGFLAVAWAVALFILWSGWNIFLPQADSPFASNLGPMYGIENAYFQTGRLIYFGAPIFIGWGVGLIATRQRLKTLWPILGTSVVALIASAAQVHAGRAELPDAIGHITMNFDFGSSAQDISGGLAHALVITSLAALPYVVWKLRRSRSVSA